jgi:cytochrome c-type biogenesis protein CcmH/NrfG
VKPKLRHSPSQSIPENQEIDSASRGKRRLFLLFLVAATFLAYFPAWNGQPLWDDDAHLTKPELRSLNGLLRIWIEPSATQQYYPLAHSAFWVEHKLWGDSYPGYHLFNILLHALNAVLVWRILHRLISVKESSSSTPHAQVVSPALLAAAIFALHPVQVESVAWITELKNTLSGAFYLGSMLVYLEFDETRRRRCYWTALVLFLLGLATKTAIVTLPAALLVIFWWQRGRLLWRRDGAPLVPFFALGIMAGLATVWVETKLWGAVGFEFKFTFVERCLIAGRSVWFHLGKLLWPTKLTFMYARWDINQAVWWHYLFPIALLALVAAFWRMRSWNRGPLAGLLFFMGTLFPVLGFFNAYSFRYSFVNDHHQYLASLGIIALTAMGIAGLLARFHLWLRPAGNLFCLLLLTILAALTWQQSRIYQNIETLWRETIRKNPDIWFAHANLGNLLVQQGRWQESVSHFEETIRLRPELPEGHSNLAMVLRRLGRVEEAVKQYHEALRLKPDLTEAMDNLAWILATTPKEGLRNGMEALQLAMRLEELAGPDSTVLDTLAAAYAEAGRFSEAIQTAERALASARQADLSQQAAEIQARLRLYRAGQSYRAP